MWKQNHILTVRPFGSSNRSEYLAPWMRIGFLICSTYAASSVNTSAIKARCKKYCRREKFFGCYCFCILHYLVQYKDESLIHIIHMENYTRGQVSEAKLCINNIDL
jgi:hypothetical protein